MFKHLTQGMMSQEASHIYNPDNPYDNPVICLNICYIGDDITGSESGDDEKLFVNLAEIPAKISHLYFIIHSYNGQSLNKIQNIYVRLMKTSPNNPWSEGPEFCRFQLSGKRNA